MGNNCFICDRKIEVGFQIDGIDYCSVNCISIKIKNLQDENAMLKLNLNMSEDLSRVLTEKVKSLESELNIRDSRVKLWERKYKKAERELKKLKKAQEEENWEYNIP